jgi:selenium metabolism protein YedF
MMSNRVLYVLAGKAIGAGHDDLGERLMGNFLLTLASNTPSPTTIFLMNSAVELAAEGSNCLDELETLANNGCEILLCMTCVEYFGLTSKTKVGNLSNMKTLVEKMNTYEKVISV